jgi:hypothetical protein
MRIWYPLLVVPLLVLVDQSLAYAATLWACAHQNPVAVHAVHAPFLLLASVGVFVAWERWRASAPMKAENETLARRHFVAGLATGVATLSVLAIVAMWAITWVLRACVY